MSLGPLMVDLRADTLSAEEREFLMSPQVGGIILFSRNFTSVEALADLVSEIHALRHPKLLVAIDQEGGRVQRLREGFTQLPAIKLLGDNYDKNSKRACRLAEITGWLMAAELRSIGIDFSFAPVLDLNHGVSQVIGDRALHKDPEIVSDLARQYIHGMRRAGMQAVGKHFPGHGAVTADSHIDLPTDSREYRDMIIRDLVPFQHMIKGGLWGIMTAHVVYEKVDKNIATYSSKWLNTVLRQQLEFKGVIFSDDLSMKAAEYGDEYSERVQKALQAGCDMVLVCNAGEQAREIADGLKDYNNPVSQVRLIRMHGERNPLPYQGLRNTKEWQQAVLQIESYRGSPYGELTI